MKQLVVWVVAAFSALARFASDYAQSVRIVGGASAPGLKGGLCFALS